MRKLLLLISGLMFLCCNAQFFNPYQTQQSLQRAYEAGKRMQELQIAKTQQSLQRAYEAGKRNMELQLAKQAAQDAQTIEGCLKRISEAIANRQFATAEEWARKLYNLDQGLGLFYMGFTNELQGFRGCAESYYTQGANLNQANCHKSINRIATSGYLTEEQINNVVNNFRLQETMISNMSAEIVNNMWQETPSSNYYENSPNRSRAAQKANCSICKGTGYDLTPYKYIANVGCHNNAGTTCHLCGQSTDHWHYKCNH